VGGLTFEVSVEVLEPASAVLVRGKGLVDELPPVSLVDQEDGTWAGLVEMPIVEDILIGFELIPLSGPSVLSDLHRLTDYGIDPAVFEQGRTPDPVPILVTEPASPPDWLWLLLAGVTAALAVVLVWLWLRWGRRDDGAQAETPEDEDAETGADLSEASDIPDVEDETKSADPPPVE
jgi:hypothetical protein